MSQKSRLEKREKFKKSKSDSTAKVIGMLIFKNFLFFLWFIVDLVLELFLGWYLGEKRTCPPLKKDYFLVKSATELAEMIRTRKLTSYEVVKAYIDRVNEVNPVLNAVIDGPFMDALDEAREIDRRIQAGEVSEEEFKEKPFLGVPFTSKDSTAVKGKLYTFCILARKNVRAKEDAECIRLMKNAGAIILATTSIPEVNKWQETRNNLIGSTNNPYDTRRTVGGSSGGEVALIASASSPFGIGTDIGGSIRMPAYYCGLFGHKGTVKVVNTRGVTERTGEEEHTMVVAGPITRYAKDLLPLFKVMAGPKKTAELKLNSPVDITKLKYYYIDASGDLKTLPPNGEVKSAMQKVVAHFSELTKQSVEKVTLPGTEYTSKMWRYWMTQEPAIFNKLLGNGKRLNPLVEVFKKVTGQSEFTWAAIYSLIDELLPKENEKKMRQVTKECEEALEKLLGDDGILFYPSYPRVAPFHYAPLIQVYNFSYWALWNVLQNPATQVPLGLGSNGMPLGIQVVATKNRDLHCMKVAEEIERAFGGFVPPFVVERN
ncbi:fatty-acid amide hydrolase 2-B [Culicoides brevitarsis]|uniref:fatty-acid amide hydrolase 2-B n=1 Tax=Culicoides brevitarsis TaxID=469753 RepID=UPI00307BD766